MLAVSCQSVQSTVGHNLNLHQIAAKFVSSQVMRCRLIGDPETHNVTTIQEKQWGTLTQFQNASKGVQSVGFLYKV
jgi:hypothetical protein